MLFQKAPSDFILFIWIGYCDYTEAWKQDLLHRHAAVESAFSDIFVQA